MNAVIKSLGQLRMMCYKAEVVMSVEAWYFLHGTTNGVCNLFYFLSLLSKMQIEDTQAGKRGQHYMVKAVFECFDTHHHYVKSYTDR